MQAGVRVFANVGTKYELGRLRLNGDICSERKSLHESSWPALYIWLRWSLDLLQAGKCSAGSSSRPLEG
jgi:hypothetical protein